MSHTHGKYRNYCNNYETLNKRNMKFIIFHFSDLTIKKVTMVQNVKRVVKKIQIVNSWLLMI